MRKLTGDAPSPRARLRRPLASLTAGQAVASQDSAAHPTGRLAGRVDRVLDAVVVLLATWTVVYHVALLVGIGSTTALVLEALALVGAWFGLRLLNGSRERRESAHPPVRLPTGVAVRVTLVAAVLAAVATAVSLPWVFVWVPWLTAAVAGTWATAQAWSGRQVAPAAHSTDDAPEDAAGGWFAIGCAVVLAVFATVTLRPNPDDLFYVNLSQWIAEHGEFPLRDTLFSNLDYPMANWPPLASYDALTGAVAHLFGIPAGDVVYVAVPPLATALAVLALWRLLRAWRVRYTVVAQAAALVFLLVDGTVSYGTPGNLFLTRLWQGKVILLCVVVPMLLVYLVRYVDRPSRHGVVWLALGGVAAVACSTTALFLVPVIAVAGALPLVLRGAVRSGVIGFVALAAYPLVGGVVTLAMGGRSADDFGARRQYRFDPSWFGHEVFLTNVLAFVGVLAVLVGCLLMPHPAARLTTAVLAASVGVVFIPGVTRAAYHVIGLGPTLWRLTWSCTIAALVGVLAAYLWSKAPTPAIARIGAAVAAVVLIVTGAPIWASDTSTRLAMPPHWQRGDSSRAMAAWAIDRAGPGGLVLAPDDLAITIAVTTTDVKTVAPRDYYMSYLKDEPGFQYDDRLRLVHFVNRAEGRREDIGPALSSLGVDIACVYRDDLRAMALLKASGYRVARKSPTYACFTA
jgi:hypothetical protein